MSRPINEPYPEQDIARNKFAIKDTRQHVEATRWYVLDDGVITIDVQDLGPALEVGFVQIGSPDEHFAFRLNRGGSLETKGVLDVSAATTGDLAWTMPGPADLDNDPYLIPFADGNEVTPKNQAFALRVSTTGDATGVVPGAGYIDSTTGDVTITWNQPSGKPPWIRRVNLAGFTVSNGSPFTVSYADGGSATHSSITGSDDWTSYFTIFSASQTRLKKQGFYLISGQFHWANQFSEPAVIYLRDGFDWETGFTYVGHSSFEDPSHAFSFPHRYLGDPTEARTIQIGLQHGHATSEDILVCYKEIWYLGPYTGSNPTFDANGVSNFTIAGKLEE